MSTTHHPDLHEPDLIICFGVSIEHADGTTECTDVGCQLPHQLHAYVASCGEFDPPCPCSPEDGVSGGWLLAA